MTLDYRKPLTFVYNEIVDLDARKCGGWGVRYYGTVTNVINANHFKKVVEVGIGIGISVSFAANPADPSYKIFQFVKD